MLSVSKAGRWLPTTSAARYNSTAPVTCTPLCSHTIFCPTTKLPLQHTVTTQFIAHPVAIPMLPGSSIMLLCSLSPAAWSGILVYSVFHSCVSKEAKMEKAWIITMEQERAVAICFQGRGGNWTSTIRAGVCSVLSPSATVLQGITLKKHMHRAGGVSGLTH